jgi:hypothetical protein
VGWLSRGASGHRATDRLRPGLATVALGAVLAVTAGACSGPPPLSARDRNWRQDIAYLSRELPAVRHARLGPVTPAAWHAAAARLEAAVPRLTGGQIVAGMARLVAMLHDDETLVEFPRGPYLTLDAQWAGSGLYLLAVPAANRALLGARLLAFDGHPVTQVLARAGTVVDAGNPQLLSNSETGALDDLDLLHSLGLAASTASATLTVMTREGTKEDVRLRPAAQSGFITWPDFFADQVPGLAHVPLPLYRQDATRPYWLQVLAAQHAVYLKYNQCLPDSGFQRLAAQALAVLKTHRDYRLVVDLRENAGGDASPFQSLLHGLRADPRLRTPGRVIGLVDQFTDSSATVDAHSLKQAGAVLMGQPPADPLDIWGNEQTFRLPRSGLVIQYTTITVDGARSPWGIPDVVIRPTLAQILAGDDPVLAAALSYQRVSARGRSIRPGGDARHRW